MSTFDKIAKEMFGEDTKTYHAGSMRFEPTVKVTPKDPMPVPDAAKFWRGQAEWWRDLCLQTSEEVGRLNGLLDNKDVDTLELDALREELEEARQWQQDNSKLRKENNRLRSKLAEQIAKGWAVSRREKIAVAAAYVSISGMLMAAMVAAGIIL